MRLLFTLALLCIVFTFGECGGVTPSPTSSGSLSNSLSGSWSPSASVSWSASSSVSVSSSWSPSMSASSSVSVSASWSPSVSVSASWSPSVTLSPSVSPSISVSSSVSSSVPPVTDIAVFGPGDDPSIEYSAAFFGRAYVEFPPLAIQEGSVVDVMYDIANEAVTIETSLPFLLPVEVCFTPTAPISPISAYCLGELTNDMMMICHSELVPGNVAGEYCGFTPTPGTFVILDKVDADVITGGVLFNQLPVANFVYQDRPVTVMVPYFIDVPNPIPNPRPLAVPVPVERPVPFPQFVDNPVPVPVANPVAVDVPYGVSVVTPVPVDVPRPVANPIMIDVPYPVALPVPVVVDVPVFVAKPHDD